MRRQEYKTEGEMTVFAFIMSLLLWPLEAVMSMVGFSLAHVQDERIPAFGFWTCWWLSLAVSSLIAGSIAITRLYIENLGRKL